MMASTSSKPVTKLRELLKEQQEPFILEVYLLERVCGRKRPNSSGRANSGKFQKRSARLDRKKAKKGISHSSRVLKAVYNKVLAFNNLLGINNCEMKNGSPIIVAERDRNRQESAEQHRFSSGRITAMDISGVIEASTSLQRDYTYVAPGSSRSLKLGNKREDEEAALDRNSKHECIEEGKLHSPVSVLEDILSLSGIPKATQASSRTRREEYPSRTSFTNHMKITEDTILSASLWNLLLHSTTEKPSCSSDIQELEEIVRSASFAFLKSKSFLQQKKQLLFDFVREAIEKHQTERCNDALLGFQEIGKIVCEKIKVCGNQSGDGTNIPKLLDLDLVHSAHEWYDLESVKKEIALEIGDSILEEIKDEVVLELNFLTE